MKRSEALKIITDIVSEVTYENLAEKRAKRILDKLEECGIKPPMIEEKSFTILEYGELTYEVNEWEPEDEV